METRGKRQYLMKKEAAAEVPAELWDDAEPPAGSELCCPELL